MAKKQKLPLTAIEKYRAIQKIGTEIEVPYDGWAKFGERQKDIQIVGTSISLGEDYSSIDQARDAVAWYVEQLGGTVKWD